MTTIIINIVITIIINIIVNANLRAAVKRFLCAVCSAILLKLASAVDALAALIGKIDETIHELKISSQIMVHRVKNSLIKAFNNPLIVSLAVTLIVNFVLNYTAVAALLK